MAGKTDDERQLLRSVCDAPDDDLPRLVYADWLEERGRADRARFIRLQIEESVGGTHPSVDWRRRHELADLYRSNREVWVRELPKWVRDTNPSFTFHRGFVEEVDIPVSPYLTFGGRLAHEYPVRDITFSQVRRTLPRLVQCPWLSRLRRVIFNAETIGDDGVATLAGSAYLNGPDELHLTFCGIGDRAAATLAAAPWLGQLSILSLAGNPITRAGLQTITASRHYGTRVRIDVRNCPHLRGPDVRQILGSRAVL